MSDSLHALSPVHAIVHFVAFLHSTGFVHASFPVHDTLHGIPAGHLMFPSHFACDVHVIVQTSLVHVPPATAQPA